MLIRFRCWRRNHSASPGPATADRMVKKNLRKDEVPEGPCTYPARIEITPVALTQPEGNAHLNCQYRKDLLNRQESNLRVASLKTTNSGKHRPFSELVT